MQNEHNDKKDDEGVRVENHVVVFGVLLIMGKPFFFFQYPDEFLCK